MLFFMESLGELQTNCYIFADPVTREAAIVDPGDDDPWIRRTITENGLKVQYILLTHAHCDHIGGLTATKEWTGAPVLAHREEVALLSNPQHNGSVWFGTPFTCAAPDRFLKSEEEFTVGSIKVKTLFTPGHSPGSLSFYLGDKVITGDALFAGSIGRTDLYQGNVTTLLQSIRTRLLTLPPETEVYPGHGPSTTIGDEKAYNPFLA